MLEFIGFIFLFLGAISFLISAVGLLRMPDVYTRMHVATKATTMGTLLIIFGAMLIETSWALKLLLLAVFILLTNPLSSSVIARASHSDGETLANDELKNESK